jgi:hypothetical protein
MISAETGRCSATGERTLAYDVTSSRAFNIEKKCPGVQTSPCPSHRFRNGALVFT